MPLESGTRLGPYEIVAPIGKGGMGEVYRARDTTLDRDVAIKVLPEELAADEERVARFEREAKVLASLNHPNIASIYGFQSNALVLELVEGPTLEERIQRGALPVDEAIAIARQIADALEAGHKAGVIHRDLKPANIKLHENGTVKVLDYGLAKALEGDIPEGADAELSQSPTLTRQGTQVGMILGTAAYMSPEQAKGKRVDRRTVWAFGAVVYEMLTARRAFEGNDVSEVLASVIAREPDWTALPPALPHMVGVFLRRCLHKDPQGRIRDIGDVRLAMDGAFDALVESRGVAPANASTWRRAVPFAVGLSALAALVTGLVVSSVRRLPDAARGVTRSSIELSSPVTVTPSFPDLAISRDGSFVVHRGLARGSDSDALQSRPELHLRRLDQFEGTPLRGTMGGANPFVSADSNWVGFFGGGELRKVSTSGGAALTVASIPFTPRGASWDDDDAIVAGSGEAGLYRLSEGSDTFEPLTEPDDGQSHRWPSTLPNGRAILFAIDPRGLELGELAAFVLDTGELKRLGIVGTSPRYVKTGHLVYAADDGSVRAVAFDPDRLEVTGNPVPLIEGIIVKPSGGVSFDISEAGRVVYFEGQGAGRRHLTWVNRDGGEEAIAAPAGEYFSPKLSPDGTRVAVDRTDGERPDIWILDLVRGTDMKLTTDALVESNPLWAPDGGQVIYAQTRGLALFDLLWRSADGTGEAERLLTIDEPSNALGPAAWSPGGETLVYWIVQEGGSDIETLSIHGDRSRVPLLATEFSEQGAALSPNGAWLAYESDESGQLEVYVQRFPGLGDRVNVSIAGGRQPLWSRDGRELFYRSPAGVMAVPVDTGPSFSAGEPTLLFEDRYFFFLSRRTYDVTPDGQRFLMVKSGDGASDTAPSRMHLIENWFEELNQRVP